MKVRKNFIELNRKAWDRFALLHIESDFYDQESFLGSRNSLNSTEIEELGNIRNKTILHLQCHFGQDTLSLETMGAIPTGVDFSSESIQLAENIRDELGYKTRFIQSDIYELSSELVDQFDIVFTSYGVLFWLNDLKKWAQTIKSYLKPGGYFYMVEFHPFLDTLDEDFTFFKYPYFQSTDKKPIEFKEKGTYADPDAQIESTTYGWPHNLGEVITSLTEAGLEIRYVHEFPFSHYQLFPNMIEFSPGKFRHSDIKGLVPYMYSIMALKR